MLLSPGTFCRSSQKELPTQTCCYTGIPGKAYPLRNQCDWFRLRLSGHPFGPGSLAGEFSGRKSRFHLCWDLSSTERQPTPNTRYTNHASLPYRSALP
ncbi:hypothetical protein AB1N83_007552 [Pleurotus pulmonarius]